MQAHGRKWAQLEAAVPTKTSTQIKNYYQNYKGKVQRCTEISVCLMLICICPREYECM